MGSKYPKKCCFNFEKNLTGDSQDASNDAKALSSEWDLVEPVFCLGQRVIHREADYRCVVIGWDRACCESAKWQESNNVASLKQVSPSSFFKPKYRLDHPENYLLPLSATKKSGSKYPKNIYI